MKTLETYDIKVGDMIFPVCATVRSMIDYETLAGKDAGFLESTREQMIYFYCTAKAGAKTQGKEFPYSYEEFLDVIDPYYVDAATGFAAFLMKGAPEGEIEGLKKKLKR